MYQTIGAFFISLLLILGSTTAGAAQSNAGALENLRQTSKAFASVGRQVSPSVVFIQVESVQQGAPSPFQSTPFGDELFKRFFGDRFPGFPGHGGQAPKRRITGQGSGFVFKTIGDKSYILTNNHVVEKADKITVTFQDGEEYSAQVTGTDPKSDIAILEMDNSQHPALKIGNSSQLEVGEWVIAVGNPFGLNHTLTVGVVSAKGRSGLGINDYEDFIQTDAAINPGNSGGPLLNLDGEVVGINTAIFSRSGGYMGVGFAIPIDLANNIADQLIDSGEVTRGYLGIVIQDLTPELAESLGVKTTKGILVSQVADDSPAAKAGLKVGDLIVRYQGKNVDQVAAFRNKVALTTPGKWATVTILRNGQKKQLTVRIGNLDDDELAQNGDQQNAAEELGFTVTTITPEMAERHNIEAGQGVLVTQVQPGSVAALSGIRPGTVILQANKKPIDSAAEFKTILQQSQQEKRILLLVKNRGMSRYIVLSW